MTKETKAKLAAAWTNGSVTVALVGDEIRSVFALAGGRAQREAFPLPPGVQPQDVVAVGLGPSILLADGTTFSWRYIARGRSAPGQWDRIVNVLADARQSEKPARTFRDA